MTWSRMSAWGVAVAAIVNVALLGAYVVLNEQANVYPTDQQFPAIGGIDVAGHSRDGRAAPCYVVRVTADDCRFCKLDYPSYTQFTRAARAAGCDVVAIAPMAGQMAPAPGEEGGQLKFVAMEFGAAIYPYLTPQTIVLDGDRKVRWHRQGAFDAPALQDGMAMLQRLGRR